MSSAISFVMGSVQDKSATTTEAMTAKAQCDKSITSKAATIGHGTIIQSKDVDTVEYDSEDNQRGGEITNQEYVWQSTEDSRYFKNRIAIAVNDISYTEEFDYTELTSATITFRYPEKARGAIVINFRLPRAIGREENPGAQDCYNLLLECPNHSINTNTLQYFQLSPDSTANDLPEAFRTGFDALKAQAGNSTFAIVQFKASLCLPTSGRLPKLRTPELDAKFRALIKCAASCTKSKPMDFLGVAECIGGDKATSEFERFQEHTTRCIDRDPIARWFKQTPHKNILNPGNLTSAEERPEVPVQRAKLVFEDYNAYQLAHAYNAAAEQEYRDRKIADYINISFEVKFQEMSGAKVDGQNLAYFAYIDLGGHSVDKPHAGDIIWITLPFDQPKVGPGRDQNHEKDRDGDTASKDETSTSPTDRLVGNDVYGLRQEDMYDKDEEDDNLDNLNCWRAQVIDNDATPQGYICAIIERRREPKSAWPGQEEIRPYVSTQIPAFSDQIRAIEGIRPAVLEAIPVSVFLQLDTSRQTYIDELRTLSDFSASHNLTALRQYILGLNCAAMEDDKSSLTDLHKWFGRLNKHSHFTASQTEAYLSFTQLIHRLAFINGPFGTGKTEFVLNVAAEFQSNENHRLRLLFCSSSNKAVDDAAERYDQIWNKNGTQKRIVRVHALKGEKGVVLKTYQTANRHSSRFTAEISDTFLYEFQATLYLKRLQDKFVEDRKKGDPRRVKTNIALSEAMLEYANRNRKHNPDLANLLLKLEQHGRSGLLKEEVTALKHSINELMELTLKDIDAVFCTINCTSKYNLFHNYVADLVIVDESCRATEISTLAPITYYPDAKAYIFVGDPKQMRPTLFSAAQERYGEKIVVNPFWRQGLLSFHDRMTRIGHPAVWLTEQHRCQGNIGIYPSQRFYHGLVVNAGYAPPETAHKMAKYAVGEMGLRNYGNIVFIAVDRSRAYKEPGSESFHNPDHVQIAMAEVDRLLDYSEFISPRNNLPGTITIEAFYRAQVGRYREQILALEPIKSSRIQVRTVDGMQGFEDDVVICDFVNSWRVGHTGEPHRLNVALTRARYLLIVIYNPDMLKVKNGDSKDINKRQANTREIWHLLDHAERNRQIIDVVAPSAACKNCGGPDHKEEDCPMPNETTECRKCGKKGHVQKRCPNGWPKQCANCNLRGHTKKNCPTAPCANCDELGHIKADCPHPPNMDRVQCGMCKEFGHFKRSCRYRKTGIPNSKFVAIKLAQREQKMVTNPELGGDNNPTQDTSALVQARSGSSWEEPSQSTETMAAKAAMAAAWDIALDATMENSGWGDDGDWRGSSMNEIGKQNLAYHRSPTGSGFGLLPTTSNCSSQVENSADKNNVNNFTKSSANCKLDNVTNFAEQATINTEDTSGAEESEVVKEVVIQGEGPTREV